MHEARRNGASAEEILKSPVSQSFYCTDFRRALTRAALLSLCAAFTAWRVVGRHARAETRCLFQLLGNALAGALGLFKVHRFRFELALIWFRHGVLLWFWRARTVSP